LAAEAGELRGSESGLHGQQWQRVVTPSGRGGAVRRGQQRVDLGLGEDGTARAYGLVNGATLTVTRSKNITSVTDPSTGEFCIWLAAGISASTTGAVVTPDFSQDDTQFGTTNGEQTMAELKSSSDDCGANALEVITAVRQVTTAPDPQGGATFVTDVSNVLANEAFFIAVP
jgi:hypothetical protein